MNECAKKVFPTIEEAQKRANEINKANKKNGDTTKLRPYKCEKCKKFHLSSMSKHQYKMSSDQEYRQKIRRYMLLDREVEYWESKLK